MPRLPLSKSPVAIVRQALEAASDQLPDFAHRFSPQKFSQPQLFAILVLRQFFHLDYRGIVALLQDWPNVCAELKLKTLPTYSTLCRAELRFKKKGILISC
jgi:hypothetical protein